jgi:hypothetical protein
VASFQFFKDWEKMKKNIHEGKNVTPGDRVDEYGGSEDDSEDELDYSFGDYDEDNDKQSDE